MPIGTLDRNVALVVIDLQKSLASAPMTPNTMADVIARSRALADAFRARNLPVILVNVAGGPKGRKEVTGGTALSDEMIELVAGLGKAPSDHLVTKRTWGAFTNTDLNDYLRDRNISQVVVTGCATSIGVDSTARQAYELGYNVAIAVDAVTDLSVEAHDNSLKRIFPRMSETGSSTEILALLEALEG